MTNHEVEEIKRHFDEAVQGLRGEMAVLRDDLRGEMAVLRDDLRGETAGLRGELRGDMAGLRGELRGDMTTGFAQVRGEMAAGFAHAAAELSSFRRDSAEVGDYLVAEIANARREAVAHTEELRTHIQTVAEGVVFANERLDALTSDGDAPRRVPPSRQR